MKQPLTYDEVFRSLMDNIRDNEYKKKHPPMEVKKVMSQAYRERCKKYQKEYYNKHKYIMLQKNREYKAKIREERKNDKRRKQGICKEVDTGTQDDT